MDPASQMAARSRPDWLALPRTLPFCRLELPSIREIFEMSEKNISPESHDAHYNQVRRSPSLIKPSGKFLQRPVNGASQQGSIPPACLDNSFASHVWAYVDSGDSGVKLQISQSKWSWKGKFNLLHNWQTCTKTGTLSTLIHLKVISCPTLPQLWSVSRPPRQSQSAVFERPTP
jgi:hypothetical protein